MKTLPRGVRVFSCDSDSLSQEHVNLAMSHVNSLTRDTLGGKCAYDAFAEEFGEDGRKLLDALGLRRVPATRRNRQPGANRRKTTAQNLRLPLDFCV